MKGDNDECSREKAGSPEKGKANSLNKVFDIIGGIFKPILIVIIGAGILQALRDVLLMLVVIDKVSSSYLILNALGDCAFYFLPIFLACSSARSTVPRRTWQRLSRPFWSIRPLRNVITARQGGVDLKSDLSQVESIKKLVTQISPEERLEDIQQGFVLRDRDPVTLSLMGNESWIFEEGKPVHAYPVTVEVSIAP